MSNNNDIINKMINNTIKYVDELTESSLLLTFADSTQIEICSNSKLELDQIETNFYEKEEICCPQKIKNKYSIEKEFKFECSHRLNHLDYDSPCKNLHGHSYKVFVKIESTELDKNGMIIDFTKLKTIQTILDDDYDHATIIHKDDNKLIDFVFDNDQKHLIYEHPTTAENMARLLCEQIKNMFSGIVNSMTSVTVKLYETEFNCASYTINII